MTSIFVIKQLDYLLLICMDDTELTCAAPLSTMREMLEPSFPEDALMVVRSFNVLDHNNQLLWIGFT